MSTTFVTDFPRTGASIGSRFARIIRAMQVARMQQALSVLSPEQLAEVGIEPDQFRTHAIKLVDHG